MFADRFGKTKFRRLPALSKHKKGQVVGTLWLVNDDEIYVHNILIRKLCIAPSSVSNLGWDVVAVCEVAFRC